MRIKSNKFQKVEVLEPLENLIDKDEDPSGFQKLWIERNKTPFS